MKPTIFPWFKRIALPLVIVALLVVGAIWFTYGRGRLAAPVKPKKDRDPVAVTVEPITRRPVRRAVTVVGSLYGRDEVALTPKVEGRVWRIHHDVGDLVKPGELMLEIDPTDYQLASVEARRSLDLELAKLSVKEPPGRDFDVRALPSVMRTASLEKNAGARYERLRRLGGGGAASTEDREQAETDYAVAKANSAQAILEAEATLAAVRHKVAMLETAQQRLRDTRVVVPTPGGEAVELIRASFPPPPVVEYVVCQRTVSEGEIVRIIPGMSAGNLFKLVIDRPLKLQVSVPERYLGEVKVGQPAELEVEAFPGERFTGSVARVNPMVDRANRTFPVEIHVPNQDRRLRAGSFARAAILTRVDPRAATVPEEALVRFAGVTKLFVVHDGKASAIPVSTGVCGQCEGKGRAWVEVIGSLPADAAIVTSGQSQLAEGTAVRLRQTKAAIQEGKAP